MSSNEEKSNEDTDASPPSTGTPEVDNCAICRNTLEGDNLSTTPCGHSFHFHCLARSMAVSPLCPICRANFRTSSPDTIPSDAPTPSTSRIHRGSAQFGLLSSIRTRPLHVEGVMEDTYRVDRYPMRVSGSRSNRTPRNSSVNRSPLEPGEVRVIRDTETSDENIQLDIDIDTIANNDEIREEIISGLIHSSCRRGDMDSTRELLSENANALYSRGDMGDLLTHEAVLSQTESVLMYIAGDQGLNVNLPNDVHMYPLHYAVTSGSLRMVTILVNRGAYIDCVNDSKMTPLMIACEEDDSDITQFLLDRGASFRTQDGSGNFPIHIATRSKSYSCVTKLISAGSTVNLKNHFHDTPLHISCRLGYHSVSRLLLEEGSDPESDNKFDVSPLDEASSTGNARMRNLLSRYTST